MDKTPTTRQSSYTLYKAPTHYTKLEHIIQSSQTLYKIHITLLMLKLPHIIQSSHSICSTGVDSVVPESTLQYRDRLCSTRIDSVVQESQSQDPRVSEVNVSESQNLKASESQSLGVLESQSLGVSESQRRTRDEVALRWGVSYLPECAECLVYLTVSGRHVNDVS